MAAKEMHPSARRLYEAAAELRALADAGPSSVARLLGESPQVVKNWEYRGVSEAGARNAEQRIGVRAVWLHTGSGPMQSAGWTEAQHANEGPRGSVAQVLSLREPDHAPTLKWGDNMEEGKLPPVFWVTLPDDSMAPRAPAGKRVQFDSTLTPGAGDGVLVRDRAGGLYFRLYRGGAAGRWTAAPLNTAAFDPLDSEEYGLQVLAVLTAEGGRWS